jgi:hypothetical protein
VIRHGDWYFIQEEYRTEEHAEENVEKCLAFVADPDGYLAQYYKSKVSYLPRDEDECEDEAVLNPMDLAEVKDYYQRVGVRDFEENMKTTADRMYLCRRYFRYLEYVVYSDEVKARTFRERRNGVMIGAAILACVVAVVVVLCVGCRKSKRDVEKSSSMNKLVLPM